MPGGVARSGLVVAVPEAEPVVGPHRLRLDASAALGAPAHVTVLFPFVPAARIDDDVLRRVAETLIAAPAFGYRFSRTAWFDDRVLYLAPDGDAPFRELTERIHAEFPGFPPFEGMFDDVVPHLTVGQDQPIDVLTDVEHDLCPRLPIEGRATELLLLVQDEPGGRWRTAERFPLGQRS